MYLRKMKKGWIVVVLVLLIFISIVNVVFAQNESFNQTQNETSIDTPNQTEPPKKRVFKGSVVIKSGSYNDYFLRVLTSEEIIYAAPGQTINFNMYARRGVAEGVPHNVVITGDDERFTLTLEPEVIPEIPLRSMIVVKASLFVSPEVEPGIYPLKIRIVGDEFVEEGYPLDTMVKVGQHSNIPNYLLLVVAAVLIVILIWRHLNIKKLGK